MAEGNKSTTPKLAHRILAEGLFLSLSRTCMEPELPNECIVVESQNPGQGGKAFEGSFVIQAPTLEMAEKLGLDLPGMVNLLARKIEEAGIGGAFGNPPILTGRTDPEGIDWVDFRIDVASLLAYLNKIENERAQRKKK